MAVAPYLAKNWTIRDGMPIYHSPGGHPQAGTWRTCRACDATFASLRKNPGHYCSRSCAVRHAPRKSSKVRPDLFERWTPDELWLAGLIWADGCLTGDGRVHVVSVDLEMMEHAARITGCTMHSRRMKPPRQTIHDVVFGSRIVVSRLVGVGLTGRKSLHGAFPTFPDDLDLRHFVRGYFDGDGSIGLYRNPSVKDPDWPPRLHGNIVGSHEFLTGLNEVLVQQGGMKSRRPHRKGAIWQLQFNHGCALKLADYMYAEPGPRLTRKFELFEQGRAQRPLYSRKAAA